MKLGIAQKIRITLLVIACLTVLIGISLTNDQKKELAHGPENLKIEVLSATSSTDDYKYYVDLEYEITNNKEALSLYCVDVTTYFTNKNGDLIGTINTTHGSKMGYAALNLEGNNSITQVIQLSDRDGASSSDVLFAQLYENGIENLDITYEITYIKWDDGYEYRNL